MIHRFTCHGCAQDVEHHVPPQGGAVGYAVIDGRQYCYDCCAALDKDVMRRMAWEVDCGRRPPPLPLYLTHRGGSSWEVSNWPGTLRIRCYASKSGRHNIGKHRLDVWFEFEGRTWHGVHVGDNNSLCGCRPLKRGVHA